MNRLEITCKGCGAKILSLSSFPALINLVADLLLKLSINAHAPFHAGKQTDFEVKIVPTVETPPSLLIN